mgnify:FL=1
MSQILTNVEYKTIGDQLTSSEFNDVVEAVDNNAQDAEPILASMEYIDEDITDIEQTHINNIQSYTVDNLPILSIEGTPAFSVEMGRPIYFKNGAWCRMHDDFPLNNLTEVDVFIVMGQSNGDGKADYANLSTEIKDIPRSDILIHSASLENDGSYIPGSWQVIDPGVNTSVQGGKFGPELGMADTINGYVNNPTEDPDFNKPVYILKFTKGGMSLAVEWDSEHADNIAYQGMIKTFDDGRSQIVDDGHIYNIRGVIWYQGESDAITQTYAESYQSNFVSLINDIRVKLNSPNLPFVAVKVGAGPTKTGDFPYIDTVRSAIQNVADDENVDNVDTLDALDYTFRSDDVHLNSDGMYQLGIDSVSKLRSMF